MANRVMYSPELKYQAVQMRLEGRSMQEIQTTLGIKNPSQIKTWLKWYRNGEEYRFSQPVGKQYSYGKGVMDTMNQYERTQLELKRLRMENYLLKKYQQKEKEWFEKYLSSL